jgi:hypothetical protein
MTGWHSTNIPPRAARRERKGRKPCNHRKRTEAERVLLYLYIKRRKARKKAARKKAARRQICPSNH